MWLWAILFAPHVAIMRCRVLGGAPRNAIGLRLNALKLGKPGETWGFLGKPGDSWETDAHRPWCHFDTNHGERASSELRWQPYASCLEQRLRELDRNELRSEPTACVRASERQKAHAAAGSHVQVRSRPPPVRCASSTFVPNHMPMPLGRNLCGGA